MSSQLPNDQPDPVLEELVAYLDGELDADQAASVEQRLADDASYRLRLQHLQQTWDLLDHLPRAQASEEFTQSTVQLVAVKAETDIEQVSAGAAPKRALGLLALAACVLAAAFAGHAIVDRAVTSGDRQLLEDLPVIENYELYLHADSVDFLLLLQQEELFTEELSNVEVTGTF